MSHQGTWFGMERKRIRVIKSVKKLEIQQPAPTKREVLITLASIYNPLGKLTPFTINMKIFMQNLWKNVNKHIEQFWKV